MNNAYNIDRIDFSNIKTYPIKERENKASLDKMANPLPKGATTSEFIKSLPDYLKAKDIIELAKRTAKAKKHQKAVILGMGAHPIKVGLSDLIIDLIKKGVITAIAMNGAGVIHDFETAFIGATSEDVAEGLSDGSFGMAYETGHYIHKAIQSREGFGYSVGKAIDQAKLNYKNHSILWNAYKTNIPVCVTVAIGNDIIHQHPEADGANIGYNSYEDFKILSSILPGLNGGGVFINLGSAVLIPETFLKSLTVARNVSGKVEGFTTANFDMIQHYRPNTNIVKRPTAGSGTGYSITGHHEIMFPLLCTMIKEFIDE